MTAPMKMPVFVGLAFLCLVNLCFAQGGHAPLYNGFQGESYWPPREPGHGGGGGGGGMPQPQHPGGGPQGPGGYGPNNYPQMPNCPQQPQQPQYNCRQGRHYTHEGLNSKQSIRLNESAQACQGVWNRRTDLIRGVQDTIRYQQRVNQTNARNRELLTQDSVQSRLNGEATEFVTSQINLSDTMAAEAVDFARCSEGEGMSTIQAWVDTSAAIANSVNQFLAGVGDGFYGGFVDASHALQAIYNNPDIVRTIPAKLVHMLSGGPSVTMNVAREHFSRIAETMRGFKQTMLYGTAHQRGEALGHLSSNLLMASAGESIYTVSINKVASLLARVPNIRLGEAVVQEMRTQPPFNQIIQEMEPITRQPRQVEANHNPEQIYHRRNNPTTQTPEMVNQIHESGELWGHARRDSYIPQVQAFRGPLPEGMQGFEFTTNIPIDAGSIPGENGMVSWSGEGEGMIHFEDVNRLDTVKIPVTVRRVNQ